MSYEKADKKDQKKTRSIRLAILLFVLLLITLTGIMHQKLNVISPVGVDALCPFGGIEAAYTLITTGAFIQRVALSSFILLISIIIIALVFRRAFCGQICPLGTLQELAGMLGKKIFKKRMIVPAVADKPGRYLKYLVLIVVVFFSALTGELILRPYDPWVAYMHLTSTELFTTFLVGFIILVLAMLGSMLADRVFCRYLCPMGAFLAVLYPLGWFGVKRNDSSCIKCGICNRECPMGIDIMGAEKIRSVECINCYTCVNVCPVKDTMVIESPKQKSINARRAIIAVLAIFILVVGATTVSGDFQWTSKSLQTQVQESGEPFDPELIKGKMTLQEVVDSSGIPEEAFIEEFGIKEADLKVPIKELVEPYGFEAEQVRAFAREYLQEYPQTK